MAVTLCRQLQAPRPFAQLTSGLEGGASNARRPGPGPHLRCPPDAPPPPQFSCTSNACPATQPGLSEVLSPLATRNGIPLPGRCLGKERGTKGGDSHAAANAMTRHRKKKSAVAKRLGSGWGGTGPVHTDCNSPPPPPVCVFVGPQLTTGELKRSVQIRPQPPPPPPFGFGAAYQFRYLPHPGQPRWRALL